MHKVTGQLGATIPDGWIWEKESHTFRTENGNVIFSSEQLGPEIDTEQYALEQGRLLQEEFRGYDEVAFESMRMMGGRSGYMRRFSWDPPDGAPVTQIQFYCVDSSRGYTATATAVTDDFRAIESTLLEILESLTIGESDPSEPGGAAVASAPLTAS
jgi:hypothetical protein